MDKLLAAAKKNLSFQKAFELAQAFKAEAHNVQSLHEGSTGSLREARAAVPKPISETEVVTTLLSIH